MRSRTSRPSRGCARDSDGQVLIPDTNVLLYAVDTDSAFCAPASAWLDSSLSGDEAVGLALNALLGFIRIATNPRIFAEPLSTDEAFTHVRAWLQAPPAVLIAPGADHLELMLKLLTSTGGGGNLTSDAHLAALAIEHRATLVSFDRDFDRFDGLLFEYLR
jgi:toxin-antitoxin system PIN domain toxin